jgi:ABC-type cobalamin/Fe3+-siderophores transport system ATPase subunit
MKLIPKNKQCPCCGTVYRYGDASVITPETLEAVYQVHTRVVDIEGSKTVIVLGDPGGKEQNSDE